MMNGQIEAPRAEIFVPPPYEGRVKLNNPQDVSSNLSGNSTNNNNNKDGANDIPEGLLPQKTVKGKMNRWSMFNSMSPKANSPLDDSRSNTSLVFTVVNKKHWREFKAGNLNAGGVQHVYGLDETCSVTTGSDDMSDTTKEKSCDVSSLKKDCSLM